MASTKLLTSIRCFTSQSSYPPAQIQFRLHSRSSLPLQIQRRTQRLRYKSQSRSIAKITLLKLKDDLIDEVKTEIIQVIKNNFPGLDHITVGENFSPGRAKGLSIGWIAYFKDLSEMELVYAQKKLHEEKFRDYVDDTIVVEFVIPTM